MPGSFVISLDFELHWGVRDHLSVAAYRENLLGVRAAIPALLDLFSTRRIHATWATVGALCCHGREEFAALMPTTRPRYMDPRLDPYDLTQLGEDERRDPYHFAPSLVEQIVHTPGQELGTHTFSHFYCLEGGQTEEHFEADLMAAKRASTKFGDDLMRSIVFPRNQLNRAYWGALQRCGVRAFRSNGLHWAYTAETNEPLRKRAYRLADAYFPLSGARTEPVRDDDGVVDVPASAFLRPWSRQLCRFDGLRHRRLASAMSSAAMTNTVFHLWWHPHNFGRNLHENMRFLRELLDHFDMLRDRHEMTSSTMLEAAMNARAQGRNESLA